MKKRLKQFFWFCVKVVGVIFFVWIVVYSLVREITPEPGAALSGLYTDAVTRQYLITEMGLDQPYPVALRGQLCKLIQFDFGVSLRTQRPVIDDIVPPLKITLTISIIVSIFGLLCAVGSFLIGIIRGTTARTLLMVFSSACAAFPSFIVALLLLPYFPASVLLHDGSIRADFMLLPIISILIPLTPYSISTGIRLAQDMRALPWFETFTALGFSPIAIAFMRGRSWLTRGGCNIVITMFLTAFTGSVAVELVCGLPGLGTAILDAIDVRDLPVVLAISGLTAAIASILVLIRAMLIKGS